jgi:hypothetical protein
MGRHDEDGTVEVLFLIFVAVVGPLAVLYGRDSR